MSFPHLLIAVKVREHVVGLLDLVLASQIDVVREKRWVDIIGMLSAHALGNPDVRIFYWNSQAKMDPNKPLLSAQNDLDASVSFATHLRED